MSAGVDRLGVLASSLCAVHCAIAALLPALLGALGGSFLLSHHSEWLFIAAAIVFAAATLVISWRRHRSRRVAALLITGVVGLLTSRALEDNSEQLHADASGLAGTAVGVASGLLIVLGHALNLRASRCRSEECA
ncbi:MerC domain-containing protein [Pseudenhygromyxa sp. WMMC2535]|uniref:MerC family mercury resistance protein n=1 Tax=Pseudenhygromyxa sp. WMMC2535 TaxID=2712867 RepID=UPI00155191B9|nr:MerC domain-containing protein [Pseudenhygromyxa sp. WMMC2535]